MERAHTPPDESVSGCFFSHRTLVFTVVGKTPLRLQRVDDCRKMFLIEGSTAARCSRLPSPSPEDRTNLYWY